MYSRQNKVTGDCLRRFRKDLGLTQAQVGERMNRSQSFVSKAENAKRTLNIYDLFDYADAFDVDYDCSCLVATIRSDLSKAGLDERAHQ